MANPRLRRTAPTVALLAHAAALGARPPPGWLDAALRELQARGPGEARAPEVAALAAAIADLGGSITDAAFAFALAQAALRGARAAAPLAAASGALARAAAPVCDADGGGALLAPFARPLQAALSRELLEPAPAARPPPRDAAAAAAAELHALTLCVQPRDVLREGYGDGEEGADEEWLAVVAAKAGAWVRAGGFGDAAALAAALARLGAPPQPGGWADALAARVSGG